MIGKKQISGK